jgi:hypothetical protein
VYSPLSLLPRWVWSALLLFSLLLCGAAAHAQLPTLPAVALVPEIAEADMVLHWDPTAAGDTLTVPAVLEDLQIGRPAPDANGVALYWTTTAEQSPVSFSIERRDEGEKTFRRVALVRGQGPGGIRRYAFVDQGNGNPQPTYYRLRRLGAADAASAVTPAQYIPGALPAPPDPEDPNYVPAEVANK